MQIRWQKLQWFIKTAEVEQFLILFERGNFIDCKLQQLNLYSVLFFWSFFI